MRLATIAVLCCFAANAQNSEVLIVNPAAPSHPFPHFWERMFGSGRAALTLRDDYRRDLRAVKSITGFDYVRFHAIFQDDVGLYNEDETGAPIWNFSYVDQIYDGLLANGVRPFVELSFMPNTLADGPPADFFWYRLNPSPPKDYERWGKMIDAFVRHLLARYGAPEVEQWYFEVWNEPNLPFWTGKPAEETYYKLYDLTSRIIRQADPKLRVGGPSTAQAAWVDRFIAHCLKAGVPFDFVSTHIYGNEDPKDVFGAEGPRDVENMVPRALQKVHDQVAHSGAPQTPIIISEFNALYLNQSDVEDSAFMGPWMANTIRECDGLILMMSYWTFSDVFEEQGIVKTPFYGGFGLIAERGIPKASFRAFELLHQLGDRRFDSDAKDALVTRRPDGTLAIALWNYTASGDAGKAKTIQLRLNGAHDATYSLRFVKPGSGSPLEEWIRMGKPDSPTREQIARLIDSSKTSPPSKHRLTEPVKLDPNELALVELHK